MGKVGPGILREINRRMILKLIRQNQPISRKHLVSLSNLGKNTVSLIAEELIMDDIIYEAYTENKKQVGRPTVALKFKEAALPVLGIVLSHNKISGAVFDYSLTQLDKQTIEIPNNSYLDVYFFIKLVKLSIYSSCSFISIVCLSN